VAELAEVVPATCHIRANVKDDDTLVERVPRRILLDRPHDAPYKLNKGAEVGEDAAHHGNRQVAMIESLAQHPRLHNGVELVVFELLENALVSLRFARVNVGCAETARTECLGDLNAVI
jgi:hypothetical protein